MQRGVGGQEVVGDGKTRPIIISLELITTTALHHVIFIWPRAYKVESLI